MLTGRSEEKLAPIAPDITQGGGLAAYVTGRPDNEDDVRHVMEATVEQFGGIDVLIPVAGTNHVQSIVDLSVEKWEEAMDVNVKGTWLACNCTALTQWMFDDQAFYKNFLARIPIGRLGEPEDLVGALIYLSSHASDFMTGNIVYLDGGYTAR